MEFGWSMVRRQGINISHHVGELGKGKDINITHNVLRSLVRRQGINIPHDVGEFGIKTGHKCTSACR